MDRFDQPLFEWCGPAQDCEAAERLARDAYALSISGIYKAHGLSAADVESDLAVSRAVAKRLAAPSTWKVTWRAAYEASEHSRAQNNAVPKRVVLPLLHDAVHADRQCLQKIAAGAKLEVGIWMDRVGQSGLVDVDSCIFATSGGNTSVIRLAETELRDAVRTVILRCVSPYHGSPGPRRGQPYQGLRLPIAPRPAGVRHASMAAGVFPPASLIGWLREDGFEDLASRLATPPAIVSIAKLRALPSGDRRKIDSDDCSDVSRSGRTPGPIGPPRGIPRTCSGLALGDRMRADPLGPAPAEGKEEGPCSRPSRRPSIG